MWCACSMNESCDTNERVISRIDDSGHVYERVMAHVWTSHGTCVKDACAHVLPDWAVYCAFMMDESCAASCVLHAWVMCYICLYTCMPSSMRKWTNHVPGMNKSCHVWMSHVKCKNESCHIWWVVPHMNESCHVWMGRVIYEWVILHMNESCHIWMSHVTDEWVMP